MATVTGLTADRMLAIEAATVVSGAIDGFGHLILTKHDGSTVDAGDIPSAVPAATETVSGKVELATTAEALSGTDTTKAVTPAGLLAGSRIQILADDATLETDLPSAYPQGLSLANLTSSSGWSLMGGIGTLVTAKNTDDGTFQTFNSKNGGTSPVLRWMRTYNSTTGGGGWTSWQQVTIVNTLDPSTFVETTALTSYPLGESVLYYNELNSSAWSFSGMTGELRTYQNESGFGRQVFTYQQANSTDTGVVWVRTWNATTGWGLWNDTVFSDRTNDLPTAMTSGTVNITPVANTPTSVHVDFPPGFFASSPNVLVTANSAVPGDQLISASAANVTTSGCDIYIYRNNTTPTGVWWLAVQN